MWPFTRPAAPEQRSYSDAIVQAILATASGGDGKASQVAAVELAAGLWGRAFASANVQPANAATRAVTPEILALIGRALVLRGEAVLSIEISGGALALMPAASWDIDGGPAPESWRYHLELGGPTAPESRFRPGAGVVHVRYSVDAERPWRGVGPLERAGASSSLVGRLELRLSEEANAKSGYVLPVPSGGQDDSVERLRADLGAMKGNIVLAETTSGGWGQGGQAKPTEDWRPHRLGADPPQVLDSLRHGAGLDLLAACGVPPALGEPRGDGTAQRESWRRFIHATIAPVGELVAAELADKLDTPGLALSFDKLFASDLSGRARAFQSMVGGGLDVAKAAALAGLMEGE